VRFPSRPVILVVERTLEV